MKRDILSQFLKVINLSVMSKTKKLPKIWIWFWKTVKTSQN